MNENSSNALPQELLAAYTDGELGRADRGRVESWLAAHPQALANLQDQESFSKMNAGFWQAVSPPTPDAAAWNRIFEEIRDTVMPADARPRVSRHYRGSWYLAPVLAVASIAAALLMAVVLIDRQRPGNEDSPKGASNAAALDEDEDSIYRVATLDDVELIELPEAAASLIVVGRHPIADVSLVLAGPLDVTVLSYGPDESGNLPDLRTTMGPDASMLWAPNAPIKP